MKNPLEIRIQFAEKPVEKTEEKPAEKLAKKTAESSSSFFIFPSLQ
jgi:hypothetical protein